MHSPRPCTGRNQDQDVSHRSSMMAFLRVVAAFLVACIAGARCTSIGCQVTGDTLIRHRRCEYQQECHVACKSACLTDSSARVYGTGNYSLESSICKSALHDLRISSWNPSAWNVSLMLYDQRRSDFRGSMRYAVTSDHSFYSQGYFQFTSPRITEEVLDITALHRDFIYNDNITSKLECHGPSDRKITFDYSIKEVDFANFTRHPEPINGTYYLALSRHQWAQARTNVFWCLVERSTLSNVGSPAMFYGPNANPTFLPQKYFVTASLHDYVTLRVQAVPGESATLTVAYWARVDSAGKTSRLTTQRVPSQWSIPTVDLYHSGVYIAQGPGNAPGKRRGVFRVIVRTCPHGIYGPSCNLKCPVCQNGGVCHDITGKCICPPGFQGETCEKPCGDDYFGRECQHRCSDTNQDKNLKSCRGILMCLPDPYGCSCGTGFHGPFCNETCQPNFYGADCKQSRKCFCKTKQFCDIDTGTCRQDNGTCLQGWKNGPYCDTSYPLLKDKPLVSGISDNKAIIQFSPWTKNQDYGEGQPKEYRIEFKVANETWSTQNVKALPNKQVYNHTLRGLKSGTYYQVRVLVVDADGNYRERDAAVEKFRTACGSPKMAPQNVTIDNSSTSEIVVKWKNPGREQWSCWSVSVILEADGVYEKNKEFNLTQSGFTSVEEDRIPVKPYTRAIIRLKLKTPNNKYSPWTQKYNVTSAEAAPSYVPDVQINKTGAREALLSWSPPQEANGILRRYLVLYKPLAFRIWVCPQREQMPTEVPVDASLTTVNLTALRPYTKYQVSVAAETILRGRPYTTTFLTTAAVPEAAPSNFHHSREVVGYDTLGWSPVPCNSTNGANQSYHLELKSNDPWDSKERKTNLRYTHSYYQDLVPYTQYEAKVFAKNEAGRSPKHASLNFRTPPAVPPAPTELDAAQQSEDTVTLSWRAPYPPYGVLIHYQLYYKSTKGSRYTERVIEPAHCSRSELKHCYTVNGLEPNQLYFFKVRAQNNGTGYSNFSEKLEIETKEMPPGPPVNLTSSGKTEDSLKIEWQPPMRRNGKLLQYKVHFRIAHTFNAKLTESWKRNPTTLDATESPEFYLPGLFPGSTYEVCITASTSAGFGEALCGNFSTKASAPVVQMVPSVVKNINNTVSIVLTPVDSVGGPITGYYLLVVREGHRIDKPPKLVNFSTAQDQRLGYYVAAHFTPNQLDNGQVNFVVGGGNVTGHFENPPLTDTTPYQFALVAESKFSGDVLYGYGLTAPVVVNSSGSGSDSAGLGTIIGVIAVVLILIIAAVSATYYYLRKKDAVAYRSKTSSKRTLKERLSRLSKLDENSMSESRMTLNMESSDSINMTAISNGGLQSKPVPVKRLQEHAMQGQEQGTLKEEYMTTPKGQRHPWDIAKKPENKSRNRYGNILPYDHSRVILAPLAGFENSDYINASYVPGYKSPRKYIATQGPKQSTLTDFWRMVWQEGSCKVVMLTNLKEQEKTKCAQYWPETSQKYGNFVVTLMKTDMQVDFVVREFQLALDNKSRTVVQFHFTTWPDHGVPLYPDALLPFLRRIWDFQPQDDHPIVVHCSGGIGRTGTLILVDSMLSQAEAEGEVNLVAHLHNMRQSRVNLVESPEQYVFAYMALVEILCSKNHKLSVKEFVSLYQKLKAKVPPAEKSAIDLEFEELNRMCPLPGPEDFRSARDAKNASKNRSPQILAGDSRRPFLSVTADGSKTDYINAVYVDGFKRRKAYLVTQMPLLDTIDDFWEMLAGSGAVTLVTLGPLEDETATPSFWPDLKSTARYGKVTVEQTDTKDFQGLVVRTFKVTQNAKPTRILRQFHSQSWTRHRSVPSSTAVTLEILQHVERWQMHAEGKTVVVQCLDGCQECGLYCVSAAICDQLKLEQELDVFRSVRNVRASRPEFIVDSDQYAFCFDLALSFLDTFETYSNFQ
ncbi:receptor-type tyrosine-protein phosphatase T-like isoform X3 [Haemaphysalis longicornis]